ncbi:MAG: glycosyltransferase family 25 protein [Nitrospinae bacterium]|nr:glycosyltransferase family 25 protein [Nitrospinota bacterium]
MKVFVINLERAEDRRRRMEEQFESLGLEATFYPAVDAKELTPDHYAQVDRETRWRLGLWPQADGSVANWISQRQVMREIAKNGPETAAIFEDDAGLSAELPAVLDALERRPFAFDVIKLNRRSLKKTFIPCERLATGHRVGRVRYHDYGSEGYVITREAARHFLENTPLMMREIDQALSRFWENGLNVFYVDPPVVSHDEQDDSQIERDRKLARKKHKRADGVLFVTWRRFVSAIVRDIRRRAAFRRLLRGEIGVTPPPDAGA